MRKAHIYLQLSGNRKATSRWCADCRCWHGTHLSLNPTPCPLEAPLPTNAPAFIPRERLGTKRGIRTKVRLELPGVGNGVGGTKTK